MQGLQIESGQHAAHIGGSISSAQHAIEVPGALSPDAEPNHNDQRQAGDQEFSALWYWVGGRDPDKARNRYGE